MKNEIQGVGVSLRQPHYQQFIARTVKLPWLEITSDNYLFSVGLLREKLLAIRENYPMVMHGVGLNLGSMDSLDNTYLTALKALAELIQPAWVSDHCCWTGVNKTFSHDLLPLPYTEEALQHVVNRVDQVQSFLQRPFIIENVSSYLQASEADYTEAEFINEVAKRSGCGILLDINNVYVSAHNHDYCADEYLLSINSDYIKQFHLAGYTKQGGVLIDTHSKPVSDAVWKLYEKALSMIGRRPTNIEWDSDIPSWDVLQGEVNKANIIYQQAEVLSEAC